MSQEKVDQYKEYKKNREKILKREKLMHRLEMAGISLVALLMVGWIGFSIYQNVTTNAAENAPTTVTEMDATAMDNYISGLQSSEE